MPREDSGQNPGVKGLGSSAWRGRVYFLRVRSQHPVPVGKQLGPDSGSRQAPLALPLGSHIVDLEARIQPVRAWESEMRWLGVGGGVVEM